MTADLLTALVERHGPGLVLYARQWCAAPEDVVQAAFLKLARLGTPPDALSAWLFKVVRNGAIDAGRAERRRQRHEGKAAARTPAWFTPPDDPTGLDARTATDALETLPADLREILVAHLWGGLTFEQIAATVGGSASTAYRRYSAALDLLRARLRVTRETDARHVPLTPGRSPRTE
jgi:RNA polymerase sigma factor (sigma-70 family)